MTFHDWLVMGSTLLLAQAGLLFSGALATYRRDFGPRPASLRTEARAPQRKRRNNTSIHPSLAPA